MSANPPDVGLSPRQVLLWFESPLRMMSTMLGSRFTFPLVVALLLACSNSHGQQLTQYAHTAWRFQEGVFDASPVSIAQTTDGFLWIGTLNGLIRFDGVRFESWNDRLQKELNTCCALSLLGSSDGSLWIGTSVGLAKLNGGKLSAVTNGDARYNMMIEDRKGRIWAARSRIRDNKGPLCEVEGTQVQCHGEHDGLGCQFGNVLAQDNSGTVWVGDQGKICSWNNGAATTYSPAATDAACKPSIESLLADFDQSILIGCQGGLRRLEQGRFVPFRPASLDADKLRGSKLLYDRGGGLWVGTTNDGLYHISNGIADHFGVADGLSDDSVSALFEDREGNIWVVTPNGIDRFHRLSVLSFSSKQGLRGVGGAAVLASRDGYTIWTSGPQGLAAIRDGKVTLITQKEGLPGQQVTALFEDHQGVLWMGIDQDLFSYSNGRFSKKVRSDGKATGMVVSMAEDASQSIWIVTAGTDRLLRLDPRSGAADVVPEVRAPSRITSSPKGQVYLLSSPLGEISILHNRQAWENVPLPTGPRTGQSLLAYDENSLFVGTSAGLYRWKDRNWSALTTRNGLPCESVQDLINDEDGGLWLHLACGFVHLSNRDMDAWSRDTAIRLELKLYDALDGARAGRGSFDPAHARTANGQLWFANGSVLQMIDPRNLTHNELPPPVHILGMVADHKTITSLSNVRLPALTRDIRIDYAALSLVSPEKVRFRYALWGVDQKWQEAGARREAHYMNLRPGHYRFQVIASNNDGVWNQQGDILEFSIAPAYYQTNWFRVLAVAAFLALLFALYRLRIRRLRAQERKLRDVVETMPTIAWTALPDGSIDFVNRNWREYSGFSGGETAGSGWQNAVHPEDLGRHLERWRASLKADEPFESEVRFRRADGVYRWFLVRAVPLRDARGKIFKWYGISTDIEERERSRQLESDLAHINRVSMLGELTASLAHEINQPITGTIINADACMRWLIRPEPDLEEVRANVMRIKQDGQRAAEIIQRLRSFYKKDTATHREPVDVNEVVGEILMLLRSEANRYSIVMQTELAAGLPKVWADRVQLQQVLMNLMLNGIEAMSGTDGKGELTITSRHDDGHVVVSVSDTGVGLPADKLDQIFMSFFTTKRTGTGMGLSITRSIVESHGGRLWAANNNGRGATFQFTLPIGAPHFDEGV